jgi:hypothetical protein
MHQRALLACGIIASLLYAAMNVVVAMRWPEYSSTAQTVSELSAIGAPTRPLWIALAIPYTLLMTLFGWGVLAAAGGNRRLRAAGGWLLAYGLTGVVWPFAPMHLRPALAAGGSTATDSVHIGFAVVTVAIMIVAMIYGALALGRAFRVYSAATLAILGLCGVMTTLDAPRLEANQPTPFMGVWERINIGVFLVWVVVFAARLWRDHGAATAGAFAQSPPPRRASS